MTFQEFAVNLEAKIIASYEVGVSLEQAELLASEFLAAQLRVSAELKLRDLDARMKKTGVKALRSAVYINTATKGDKKPTEASIAATIDTDAHVMEQQRLLDTAEVERDELERYYNIFQNAHVHYRNVAKGTFGG